MDDCSTMMMDQGRRPGRFLTVLELLVTMVQIIAAIVVLSLTVAKDEHPQTPLVIWVIGYTCACMGTVLVLSWRHLAYTIQDLSRSTPYTALAADEENNIQDDEVEYLIERTHRVMDILRIALECFFLGWFWGYRAFYYDDSALDDGSLLCWLVLWFFLFNCFRTEIHIMVCGYSIIQLITEVIKAFYACIIRSNDVDSEWEGEGEDNSCCCICLGKRVSRMNK